MSGTSLRLVMAAALSVTAADLDLGAAAVSRPRNAGGEAVSVGGLPAVEAEQGPHEGLHQRGLPRSVRSRDDDRRILLGNLERPRSVAAVSELDTEEADRGRHVTPSAWSAPLSARSAIAAAP